MAHSSIFGVHVYFWSVCLFLEYMSIFGVYVYLWSVCLYLECLLLFWVHICPFVRVVIGLLFHADYKTGFGGQFGVQQDRQDKSAVGFDYKSPTETHESQKGIVYFEVLCVCVFFQPKVSLVLNLYTMEDMMFFLWAGFNPSGSLQITKRALGVNLASRVIGKISRPWGGMTKRRRWPNRRSLKSKMVRVLYSFNRSCTFRFSTFD